MITDQDLEELTASLSRGLAHEPGLTCRQSMALIAEVRRLRAIKSAEVAAEILGEVRSGA